jgi:hypothetical protein
MWRIFGRITEVFALGVKNGSFNQCSFAVVNPESLAREYKCANRVAVGSRRVISEGKGIQHP